MHQTRVPTPSSAAGRGGDHYGMDQTNLLRVSTRSKDSETHVDVIRATYPLKLVSTKSTRVAPPLHLHPSHSPIVPAIPTSNDAVFPEKNKDSCSTDNATVNTTRSQKRKPPPTRIVYMIAYGGGLLKDDHPHLQIELGPLSRLLILGQGSTKVSKCPSNDYPPASQTIHSTVGPGAVFLFLGPPVVASEDSSTFLKHEIILQATRSPPPKARRLGMSHDRGNDEQGQEGEDDDTLPSCVALDWIAGGRGEEERWKARRIEWRMVVRWSELDDWPTPSSEAPSPRQQNSSSSRPDKEDTDERQEDEIEDDFMDEEDPRDVADRLAGGPVIFRDGFLLENDDSCPKPRQHHQSLSPGSPMSQSSQPQFSTSYAASIHPHSTIGTLFIIGPKTERLQRAILRRFAKMTVYPGQKAEVRPDYPILWSATSIQVTRPKPKQESGISSAGRSQKTKPLTAVVVKMATQGVEQMQDFLKTLFEEKHLEDTPHFEEEKGTLSVIEELFGGRVVWDRALR
ncbi:hypothetical protein BGW42_003964 [Actinomortierella wolfii]|nr:hypothetical protein BGW42_003964 [Actinomortierella wolfii]